MQPLLCLDLDDTICLNNPYGGYDVVQPQWPDDLSTRLWHIPALDVLRPLVEEFQPRVVITSSWLRIMMLESIASVFRRTGVSWLADALHPNGEALQNSGWTRLEAINKWLAAHHMSEPYVIVDDHLSGSGLAGSRHERTGRLVLCDVDVGLLPTHTKRIRQALTTPFKRP